MQGYWRDPAGTEEVLRGGVYRTGDLGYADEEGYFYITGRARDILKVRGFRVSPRDIEEVLAADSEVAEAAVVGTDDELLGEVPVAFVVPRDASPAASGTEDEWEEDLEADSEPDGSPAFAELAGRLRTAVGGRLPSYMVPKEVRCVPSLPHTSSGKVDKRALRELLSTASA
jgi:acyl-coenzyme A synthetase/AMP-(fatty) acid ligase